ncbi:hypothetical protein MSAN_01119400 [Mycena sanguinolenta]|uniref:F-box domain-containing protein n=1 Tax=Mycena sanguinolenta TaxID=230812 RepID=A0A8H7D692_9AGAR|nr:hypothetical protein MSAN_01119400 [Mycena sanguinolenta]
MRQPVDYQHLVPAEVWMTCWALCDSRQLRRISMHQTLDIEVLVRRLTPDNWIDHFHHLHRTAVRLDSLAASPFHTSSRSYIKHMKMFDTMQDRVTSTFFTTLGLYRNISSLHIKTYRIDAAAWQTLLCLSMLHTLHLDAYQIDTGDETSAIAGSLPKTALVATRQLRGLHSEARKIDKGNEISEISGSRYNRGLAAPRKLRSLHLPHARLLLDAFSASELPYLVHLSIQAIRSAQDMEPFVRFVEQCPRLESLTVIGTPPTSPLRYIDIPPHSLSLLHTLTGPSYLSRSLAPGRPIRSVRVVEHGLDIDNLLSLCIDISRSTVPVHALALPRAAPTLGFLQRLLALFPDVRELYLRIQNPMPSGISFCVWPKHPNYVVDERVPLFCDADAFDGLPAEELSDDETKDDPAKVEDITSEEFRARPVRRWSRFLTRHTETILTWIFDGLLDLPFDIKSLRLETNNEEEIPLERQHQALVSLSKRYARLHEVQVGKYGRIWRREGSRNVWKAEGMTAVRIVRGTNDDRESVSAANYYE